ncbi:MAG TPA: orotidine-5'-phosphate decarboxylase [Verrucomicrobiota bacterium]|jgi:orotidine-5'-phosphate decarboxylase|nr:orotidine-5'-phosphate decarboxylase [Verrucomicrobiota bacterium]
MKSFLSSKHIPVRERLIFALDVPSFKEAQSMIDRLGDSVCFYKLGLQLFMTGEYFKLVEKLQSLQKKIFVDLKFFDVPETVKNAVEQLQIRNITFATVHGNDDIMSAAASVKGDTKILAVTVLTSLDEGDMKDLGFDCDVQQLVLSRARRALTLGCDGVISSGLEVRELRENLDEKLLVITPGIRPASNVWTKDDQKRIVTVQDAFFNGADYVVVGRPIRSAADPRMAAEEIQQQIEAVFNTTAS